MITANVPPQVAFKGKITDYTQPTPQVRKATPEEDTLDFLEADMTIRRTPFLEAGFKLNGVSFDPALDINIGKDGISDISWKKSELYPSEPDYKFEFHDPTTENPRLIVKQYNGDTLIRSNEISQEELKSNKLLAQTGETTQEPFKSLGSHIGITKAYLDIPEKKENIGKKIQIAAVNAMYLVREKLDIVSASGFLGLLDSLKNSPQE